MYNFIECAKQRFYECMMFHELTPSGSAISVPAECAGAVLANYVPEHTSTVYFESNAPYEFKYQIKTVITGRLLEVAGGWATDSFSAMHTMNKYIARSDWDYYLPYLMIGYQRTNKLKQTYIYEARISVFDTQRPLW